ncbi:CRAL/TRIO domain [Musa troglodytarum]|uniref:CRAL/TRIO domain n=1 Tax=Musa troglodytarum TaxID=320322 RepID=A0A9E7GZ06_9LILI|nr:CRAL/TRIO domain [Musa troglodytarum]
MTGMEGLHILEDRKERRSDVENSEDERRRLTIGALKKKALSASSRFTHSLKKRGKRKDVHRTSSVSIEDVRDVEEERAVYAFRKELISRELLPEKHDDYHMLLRQLAIPTFPHCSLLEFCMQGLKNFSKTARDLLLKMQKIDGDYYPEGRSSGTWTLESGSDVDDLASRTVEHGRLAPVCEEVRARDSTAYHSCDDHIVVVDKAIDCGRRGVQSNKRILDFENRGRSSYGIATPNPQDSLSIGSRTIAREDSGERFFQWLARGGPSNIHPSDAQNTAAQCSQSMENIEDRLSPCLERLQRYCIATVVKQLDIAESLDAMQDFKLRGFSQLSRMQANTKHTSFYFSLLCLFGVEGNGAVLQLAIPTFLIARCWNSACRFLKARKFDREKAVQMWVDMLHWRKEFGTDTILEGLKNFSKTARDLLLKMQKIDGDYYPEVLGTKFHGTLLEVIDSREGGPSNIHPSDAQNTAAQCSRSMENIEDRLSPCLERLQRLEMMFDELTNKHAEIPFEKERVLLESWDRIKHIEFDLEKTKRVLHATVVKQLDIAESLDAMQDFKLRGLSQLLRMQANTKHTSVDFSLLCLFGVEGNGGGLVSSERMMKDFSA